MKHSSVLKSTWAKHILLLPRNFIEIMFYTIFLYLMGQNEIWQPTTIVTVFQTKSLIQWNFGKLYGFSTEIKVPWFWLWGKNVESLSETFNLCTFISVVVVYISTQIPLKNVVNILTSASKGNTWKFKIFINMYSQS